jgi:hypothetical protein
MSFRIWSVARALVIGVAGVLLVGCASGPTFTDLHAREPAVATDRARIYFYREASVVGAAVQPVVYVNGEAVGQAVPGGYFYIDRPAGEYVISTTTEKTKTIKATVRPGETRYVKFDIGMGVFVGHILPTLVMPGQGAAEIARCHYLTGRPTHPDDKGRKKSV